MTSLARKQHGFTIVELLIVIVVIGILAALVITTFSGIQQKARDTERQTDIKALHGQMEAYAAQSGSYPTLAQLNDSTATTGFRAVSLKGLDAEAFKDPKWDATATACATASTLAGTVGAKCYGYVASPAACAAGSCSGYVLTATLEGTINGASTFAKSSLN